jgi:hypothetical protein
VACWQQPRLAAVAAVGQLVWLPVVAIPLSVNVIFDKFSMFKNGIFKLLQVIQ